MRQFLKALVTMQQEVSGWLALKGLRPPLVRSAHYLHGYGLTDWCP